MSLVLNDQATVIEAGLGAYFYNVLQNGIYTVSVQSSVVPPSSLDVIIMQNLSQLVENPAPTVTQQVVDIEASNILCSEGDVIYVTISSAAPIDNALNNIKSIISIIVESYQ